MEHSNPISPELLDTIERYLKNNINTEERVAFDKKLKENPILQQQVKDTETILFGVRKAFFKNKAVDFHEELVQDNSPVIKDSKVFKLNFKSISIAASIVILFGCFWFLNQQTSNENIFNKYYIEDRGLETNMSKTDNYAFEDAMVDYKYGEYNTAIYKWNTLLKNKPKNDTLNYFIGVAHLANKNEIKSENYLKIVIETTESEFLNDAYFYLGLTYLKMDNIDLAIENLEKSKTELSKTIISELKK